jgi:magnesium transporter
LVADGKLRGIIPFRRLVAAGGDEPVAALVQAPRCVASEEESPEHVAHRAAHNGASSVWINDADGGFVGLVPTDRISQILLTEHEEDLARLGGYRVDRARARRAAEEGLGPRLLHRLPWLVIGLAGAMASTLLVASFEDELRRVVLLSFFVPAVVYMADAVGTQTETVLIRALAAGVRVRDVMLREIVTGFALGILVAILFFPFAAAGWGDEGLALGVALALLVACGVATTVAMLLPAAFQRFGADPAFGSGPLATVIQDLLSIAVYFAIAVPLAT